MAQYRLVSFYLCPFVQRAAIVLEAKNVPYEIEYIDLSRKPDWFAKLSPLGKVPLLQVDGTVLFESQVIAEYLDEVEAPQLHPEDPLRRAQHRAVIEVVSLELRDFHALVNAQSEQDLRRACLDVCAHLAPIESHFGEPPFFDGSRFSLVDAAAAPLLQRLSWVEELCDFGFFDKHPRLAAWRDTLLVLPDVKASTVPDIRERFRASLKGYLKERCS